MQLILNNPYRTVGLLVGATAKEQERQVRRLKQFIEAEQEPQDDFSFPTLGKLQRTVDSVTDAASKLNLDRDKITAALFWFYRGNAITDEPAFDSIKDAGIKEATAIWSKLTNDREVDARNASAFNNLSTLMLNYAINGTIKEDILEKGIRLKLKFLESEFIKEFKALATDETYKTTKKELQLSFLSLVQIEVDQNGGINDNKMLEILSRQEFSAKQEFLKGFAQKPLEQIEKKVEEAKAKRKSNKANAVSVGKELFEQTAESIRQVQSILGTSNLQLSSISDKVSDEILQCGIEYFSHYRDSSTDPSSASMDLFRKAKTLAVGSVAKQRCQENTENLQEWIDEKPEREKQQRIIGDFQALKKLLDEYEIKTETVANAKSLLSVARPYLLNIKTILGSYDETYLGFSSRIASDAQGMCVSEINHIQKNFTETYDNSTKRASLLILKDRVDQAWEVTTTIGAMDLLTEFRARYTDNRDSLSSLKNQLSTVTRPASTTRPTPQNASSEIPGWVWVVGVIILFIIIGQCNN